MASLIKLVHRTYKMIEHPGGPRVLHNVTSLSSLQVITYILPVVILPYLFRVVGRKNSG